MARDLKGRRLLITGASSGIGRSLAEQAASAGARLVIAARSADKLTELTNSLGSQADVLAVPADVTVAADRDRLLDTVAQRWGGLDVLINNAGIASFGHFSTSTEEILRQIMEVNFFAPAELTRMAIPWLLKGTAPAIVNVASMCGRCGMPAWPEYSASKFALCGLSEALRGEFVRFGIDLLLIVPGLTRTEFRDHQLRHEGKLKLEEESGMTAEEVARAVLVALGSNRRETVLGWDARWMIRVHRFFPGLFSRLLARKVRKLYAQP
jgi:short-subunit dehydrogenase